MFAADKVVKARELRIWLAGGEQRRRGIDPLKLDHYWGSLAVIESRLGKHPFAWSSPAFPDT